jgi:hypothetical protein
LDKILVIFIKKKSDGVKFFFLVLIFQVSIDSKIGKGVWVEILPIFFVKLPTIFPKKEYFVPRQYYIRKLSQQT